METFFAFIDETGDYNEEKRSSKFPYYLKACVIIPANSWTNLANHRHRLCKTCGIDSLNELKWSHLWQLRRRDIEEKSITFSGQQAFLNNVKFEDAEKFVRQMLANLGSYNATVLVTITPNCVFKDKVAKQNIEKFHYQDLMQRVEMEMSSSGSLAVIISDQLSSTQVEKRIRNSYSRFFSAGDFIENYSHILDSISFQCSHHSCGLQLADFVVGAIHGFLREYKFSQEVARNYIFPSIRTNENGDPFGHGIIDVPKREKSREHLVDKFKSEFMRKEDIPF